MSQSLTPYGHARLPTIHGPFVVTSFLDEQGRPLNDIAVYSGDIAGAEGVPTRVHSECITGEVFGSLRCDCREQLEAALHRFAGGERGLLLYLRQEGRGLGLGHKIRAYELQDQGLDTVDANLHLGFPDDARTYEIAAAMLRALDVRSIVLLSNNPKKSDALTRLGVRVQSREPLVIPPRPENREYLATKRKRSGHLLP